MRCGRRRTASGKFEGHDLLLNAGRIAVRNAVEAFFLAGFVRRVDATLDASGESVDSVFPLRAQQRVGGKLHVIVGLAAEAKKTAHRLFDMVEREA